MKRTICMAIAAAVAGCSSVSDRSPWADVVMKDENTRAADPRWFGVGQLWAGVKCKT